jgi:transcriptional regulator with XRE-family HTH domain
MEVAMSVEVMAQKACVSRSLVNKFEAGKAHPSVDTLSRLAKVLKVSIADLYED